MRLWVLLVCALTLTCAQARIPHGQATGASGGGGGVTTGVWTNVTPTNVDLTNQLTCGNFGVESVAVDTANPSNYYFLAYCQGIWKSTDYGQTWTGPINSGASADCAGWIAVAPVGAGQAPIIYETCIRGAGIGFWKSTNGGSSFVQHTITTFPSNRQDAYPVYVDPYDNQTIIVAAHEQDLVATSSDGGTTWTNVPLNAGMIMGTQGGSGFVFYIDTGNATTTKQTLLWLGQASGGTFGTWRSTNGGSTWTQVDKNEHPHGASQIYQPNTTGTVFMAGVYSNLGWGVLRSTDYGATWSHVGISGTESVVTGTPKNVYAEYGWSVGLGGSVQNNFELSPVPGTGTWTQPATPSAMGGGSSPTGQGPSKIIVTNDGAYNILVSAQNGSGVWRYVEP